MRSIATFIGLSIGTLSVMTATAQTINLATGLDSSGNLQLTGNLLDANWTITNGANPIDAPNAYTVDNTDADWYSGWVANGPNSTWIAANPDDAYGNGYIDAFRTFNLTADQVASASFSNTFWTIDDEGYLLLNGVQQGYLFDGNWGALAAVTLNTADLQVGTNTIEIEMINSDTYLEGDRFEGTLTTTPEPSPFLGLGLGIGAMLIPLRRRKTRAKA